MKIVLFLALVYTVRAAPTEEDAVQEFTDGNHRFSANLYKELTKVKSGNMVMSPFSAQTVLALTHEGARGESAEEMVSGLSLPSTNEKIQQAFKSFLPKLASAHKDLKLSTANKVYVGQGVKLEDEFKQVAENIFESGAETVNFASNVEAAAKINSWVEDRTERRIKNLIDPVSIGGDTKMVLVNTLYLKGRWQSPFYRYRTAKRTFHVSKDETVEVDMMGQTEYLKYYENSALKAKFLEMSYSGGNVSMVFILPNDIDGLPALEQNMDALLAPQPFELRRVDVKIPKFKIETEIEMIPILEKLGIKKIFDGEKADLSGLSSTNKHLVISKVIQKVYIDVNEDGTEAAASTAVVAVLTSMPLPPSGHFIADHPFAFYIKCNGVILFVGRFSK
nr:alaserpin-like isoform X1 [Leptinotarsa decemlineata]